MKTKLSNKECLNIITKTIMTNFLVETFTENDPIKKARFSHLIVMMFGILQPTRLKSCREIGLTIPGSPDGSNLNDSLRNNSEYYETLFISVLYSSILWMKEHVKPGTPIFLSIDDSFISKSAKQRSLPFVYYCGHKKGTGFYIVAGHIQIGKYHLPLGYRLYRPGTGITKQELAGDILEEVASVLSGFTKVTVLSDSGYADKKLMKYVIEDCGWSWLSGIKCNRCINHKAVEVSFRGIPNREYDEVTLYKRKFLCVGRIGYLNDFSESGLFIATKTKKSYKPVSWRYYYCSNKDLTVQGVLRDYVNRWRIENDFWTLKEQLGINEFRLQTEEAVESYLHIVYITYLWINHTKNQWIVRDRTEKVSYGTGDVISVLRHMLTNHFLEHGERSIEVVVEEFMKWRLQRQRTK